MLPIALLSPAEIGALLAERLRRRRLDANLTRDGLASRAGVSPASLKRFERTGAASLEAVVRIAIALDAAEDFAGLFAERATPSIDSVLAKSKKRMRGRAA